jgi:hypothetical protein
MDAIVAVESRERDRTDDAQRRRVSTTKLLTSR